MSAVDEHAGRPARRGSVQNRLAAMLATTSTALAAPGAELTGAAPPVATPPPAASDRAQLLERLRRLMRVAADEAAARATPVSPQTELLSPETVWGEPGLPAGTIVENRHGPCYAVRDIMPLPVTYGISELGDLLRDVSRELSFLLGEGAPDEAPSLSRAVFLDTETTGLSGGTGAAAFLIGLARFRPGGGELELLQLVMRDYDEEPAMLAEFLAFLEGADLLVTYNGKAFDWPLLASRLISNRLSAPAPALPHLDALPVARRLWRLRLGGCRLVELERPLLAVQRVGDVPGYLIPNIYFDFVRGIDRGGLRQVLYHNRLDVLSLMGVTSSALSLLGAAFSGADTPLDGATALDLLSVARYLAAREEPDLAIASYRRALGALGQLRERWQGEVELGRLLLKQGDTAGATASFRDGVGALHAWPDALTAADFEVVDELAKVLEHRHKLVPEAAAAVTSGLTTLADRLRACQIGAREAEDLRSRWDHRLHRLKCKAEGRRWY
ncbi:MAG: ribonuclease H-like domain-containing protein [Candidatus Schekmanbacteria bacterium]|nr:ribonuclease H-like domain-containing protein [Candidatus Schekmanbacteria bacterium]